MSAAQPGMAPKLVGIEIGEAHARLDGIERQEWWRWMAALGMMLVLTAGLLALSMSGQKSTWSLAQIRLLAVGAAVLVVLFAIVTIWKQTLIARTRRELASQIGVIAALETLNLVVGNTPQAHAERRKMERSNCDTRLSLTVEATRAQFYGRVRDLCEHGIGAIVPAVLNPGEQVLLEFQVVEGPQLRLRAFVRHRSGFRYGFEFVEIGHAEYDAIERFRSGEAEVVSIATGKKEDHKHQW